MLMTSVFVVTSLFLSDATARFQDPAEPGRRGRGVRATTTAPARGGRGGPRRAVAPVETHVFRLKHGEPHSLAKLVQAACDIVAIADERTNSVTCAGTVGGVGRAVELLEELDQPADAVGEVEALRIVPVKHREARDIAIQLMETFHRLPITFSADRGRSTIVASGASDLLKKAMSIIEALDTPSNSATLEFAFFKASLNADGDAPAVPQDLEVVAAELRRFGRIELLGRASTLVVEREKFEISGNLASLLAIDVHGHLLSASNDGSVKVNLEASLAVDRSPQQPADEDGKASPRSRRPGFELETTVSTTRGDYVVLGSAPSGWKAGESAILVLHVRP
jgi:hypothetical protein